MWRAGGPGGAVRWAPSPARLSLPKVAVPCLPGLGTRSRIGVRFSADISQSGPAWWGWREYRGKSVRGRRWRPRPDIGPGDWTSSGRPAPSGPVLSQCPECENGLEVGVGDGEQSLRVVDRFRFCSISKLDCGRLMLGLRLTGLAWGCSTRTLRHLRLVRRQVWVGERDK